MNLKSEESLSTVLSAYLQSNGKLKDGIVNQLIIANWEQWMGKAIADYTEFTSYADQKLKIKISSGVLKADMYTNKEKIQAQLNSFLHKSYIREIILL